MHQYVVINVCAQIRVVLGFESADGAVAAEPKHFIMWQEEAQKHVDARYQYEHSLSVVLQETLVKKLELQTKKQTMDPIGNVFIISGLLVIFTRRM